MGKNAVMSLGWQDFFKKISLKKQALLFEKIYISELTESLKFSQGISMPGNPVQQSQLNENLAMLDYLQENKIIHSYIPKYLSEIQSEVAKPLVLQVENLSNNDTELREDITTFMDVRELSKLVSIQRELFSLRLRLDAIDLTDTIKEDFFPIINSLGIISKENKKSQVASFILENIPEPDESTPWEQIIEFRNDPDVRNKYLSLINWINKVSATESNIIEIKEEYEYLYNDYIRHFNLHRMKYNNTKLEVIVTFAAGLLLAFQSGEFITPLNNFLKMKLSYVNLLQEEAKLPGKEVAYIYDSIDKFGKK